MFKDPEGIQGVEGIQMTKDEQDNRVVKTLNFAKGPRGVEGIQETRDNIAKILNIAGSTIGADLQQEKATGSGIIFLGVNEQEDTEEMLNARKALKSGKN